MIGGCALFYLFIFQKQYPVDIGYESVKTHNFYGFDVFGTFIF